MRIKITVSYDVAPCSLVQKSLCTKLYGTRSKLTIILLLQKTWTTKTLSNITNIVRVKKWDQFPQKLRILRLYGIGALDRFNIYQKSIHDDGRRTFHFYCSCVTSLEMTVVSCGVFWCSWTVPCPTNRTKVA
jgi:hypothetical protein